MVIGYCSFDYLLPSMFVYKGQAYYMSSAVAKLPPTWMFTQILSQRFKVGFFLALKVMVQSLHTAISRNMGMSEQGGFITKPWSEYIKVHRNTLDVFVKLLH